MNYNVTDFLTQDELLAQLAEETAELSQAALKMRRVLDGRNPTPVGYQQALKDLNEEVADVQLCLDMIGFLDADTIKQMRKEKLARWLSRLLLQREKEERRMLYAEKNSGN